MAWPTIFEGFGSARYCIAGDTEEEARCCVELATFEWTYFFHRFGFTAVLARRNEDWRKIPLTMELMTEKVLTHFTNTMKPANRQAAWDQAVEQGAM